MAAAIAVGLTVAWLLLARKAISLVLRAKAAGRLSSNEARTQLLERPFAEFLERSGVFEKAQLPLSGYHAKQVVLHGTEWRLDDTKRLLAAAAGGGYAALTASALLAWLSGETVILTIGALVGCLLPVRRFTEAGALVIRRKQAILLELPETLSKLMLLVGAGETVQQAFMRCVDGKDAESHPLYKEWAKVVRSLRNGESFGTSIERFNRSCAVQEVSVFTTVLLLNYRRGGEHFVLALRELNYSLWEKRKAVARSKGEEASSKLVFPLVGILLVLMVLVAAPALLLMS
ncbi:type II secretion system F family protein [Paenibacillus sp. NPDC058071]|uniref:type II secretion system F family protein n=1 Tax=Paenibacillus sp. NPDC058071 TaxID=3346326 RepID=UPI0036DDBC0F